MPPTARRAHRRQAPALLVTLLVTGALVAAGASPAGAAKKTPTPITALDTFAFTFSLGVVGSGSGTANSLTVTTDGTFAGPASQDCTAAGALGALKVRQHAVVKGKKVWLDSGNGFARAKASDLDFAGECPSDPSFWDNFDLSSTRSLSGTPETKNGIAVEHLDLGTDLRELSALGIFDKLPADVSVDTLDAWRAVKGGWIAALDVSLTASSDATCADILGNSIPVAIPAPCTVTVHYDITRPNDKTITVSAPKTSKTSK